jgi:lipoprotein-anchoring transpeptidase ErfK/SrfK
VPEGPLPAAGPVPASSTIAYLNGPPNVQVYAAPDVSKPLMQLPGRNTIDQPAAFLVTDQTSGWFQVLLPVQPNGSRGWVKADSVQTATTNHYLRVFVPQFRLAHYVDGHLESTYRVAVGKPRTPTPTGLFYIWGSQVVDQAPYTPGILALSGFSAEPIPGFLGARLGIHGWTDPSVVGKQVSNGCVRMTSKDIDGLLHTLLLGTPVEIIG